MPLGKQVTILSVMLCISGFLGAAFFALAFVGYSYMTDTSAHMEIPRFIDVLSGIAGLTFMANIISIPSALIVGYPTFFLLRRFGLLKWWAFCAIGMLAGFLIGIGDQAFPVLRIAYVGVGVVSALISWLYIAHSGLPSSQTSPSKPNNGGSGASALF